MNTRNQEILDFINHFRGATDTFSNGCCYWFARILKDRFPRQDWDDFDPEIMYTQIDNHFGCLIDGIIYDVTGDVTYKYKWERWCDIEYKDELLYKRIVRDCVLKLSSDSPRYSLFS